VQCAVVNSIFYLIVIVSINLQMDKFILRKRKQAVIDIEENVRLDTIMRILGVEFAHVFSYSSPLARYSQCSSYEGGRQISQTKNNIPLSVYILYNVTARAA